MDDFIIFPIKELIILNYHFKECGLPTNIEEDKYGEF